MRPELAVVFPRAGVEGGVERVTLDFLRYEAARRPTTFVGLSMPDDVPVDLVRVSGPLSTHGPIGFRSAARRSIAALDRIEGTGDPAPVIVSMGVECPPGDVLWVHSVHAAWLRDGGDIFVRGRRVPSRARYLLPRHQALLVLERRYFTRSRPRAVLCTSAREVDDLAEIYGVPRELMHVVPNGYDRALFSPARTTQLRAEAREFIGATAEDIVVLLVANEWHRKGVGTVLRAVAALGDPRVRIDLVGAGDPRQYVADAALLGLDGRCRWHGPSSDVAFFHAAADIFVLPTTYEPFGLVIVEAMASGLPVITSALAGAARAITDGVDGYLLADPRSVPELTAALARLLDSVQRVSMGAIATSAAEPFEVERVLAAADRIIFPTG